MDEIDRPCEVEAINPVISLKEEIHYVLSEIEKRAALYLKPGKPDVGSEIAQSKTDKPIIQTELEGILAHARFILKRF